MGTKSRTTGNVQRLVLVVIICMIWEFGARLTNSIFMPQLNIIARQIFQLLTPPTVNATVVPSLVRWMIGLLLAMMVGSMLGFAMGRIRYMNLLLRGPMEYIRFIPAVAILPAALVILGDNDVMRIFIIFLGAFFPIFLSALDAARRIDIMYIEVANLLGLNRWRRLWLIIVPSTIPAVIAGMRVAVSIGLVMMVISELMAASDGLGFYILRAQRLFRVEDVYAGILVIGALGFSATTLVAKLDSKLRLWETGS